MNAYLENIENLVRCLLLHPTRVGRSLCLVKDETFLKVLEENLDLSNRLNLPVCQDTGVVTLVVGHDSLTRDELLEIKTAFEKLFQRSCTTLNAFFTLFRATSVRATPSMLS